MCQQYVTKRQTFDFQEKRELLVRQYDEAMTSLKTSKDMSAFAVASKKIAAEQKIETQEINDMVPAIKAINAEAAERILEVQKLDRAQREIQQSQANLLEKLIGGKINKQQYLDQESQFAKKREDLSEKLSQMVSLLRM